MQPSLSHIIYQKLQKLVKEFEQLKKDHQKLKSELHAQLTVSKEAIDKVKLLESQVALLKSNAGQMDAVAKKDMETRIQQYIRDIDNAIQLLNE